LAFESRPCTNADWAISYEPAGFPYRYHEIQTPSFAWTQELRPFGRCVPILIPPMISGEGLTMK
jgi:hypothetical protein